MQGEKCLLCWAVLMRACGPAHDPVRVTQTTQQQQQQRT